MAPVTTLLARETIETITDHRRALKLLPVMCKPTQSIPSILCFENTIRMLVTKKTRTD